jgi:hypothetical protein
MQLPLATVEVVSFTKGKQGKALSAPDLGPSLAAKKGRECQDDEVRRDG